VQLKLPVQRGVPREDKGKKIEAHGRHKKQSGGSRPVRRRLDPLRAPGRVRTQMVFNEEVFGGSVPKNFFPAVEKGLRECTVNKRRPGGLSAWCF
jgi:elongation factor G